MITTEQEYFIRFMRTLLHGGTTLLRALAELALTTMGITLGEFLQTNEAILRTDQQLGLDQLAVLYPETHQGAHIDEFDISLLAHLIVNYLYRALTQTEVRTVCDIRSTRNRYAHIGETSMRLAEFIDQSHNIKSLIETGYSNLRQDVKYKLNNIIKAAMDDPLDTTALAELDKLDECSSYLEARQQSLHELIAKLRTLGLYQKVVFSQDENTQDKTNFQNSEQ